MLKLIKYLKKSALAIMFIFIFLMMQAYFDLSLPAYTSNIVNIGIQQGGIEHATPKAIREKEMNTLLLFTTKEEKENILSNYTLLLSSNTDKKTEDAKEKYPALQKENIYVLKDSKKIKELDKSFATPILITSLLTGTNDQALSMQEAIIQNIPGATKENILTIIASMPEEARGKFVLTLHEKLKTMPDTIVSQSAIYGVKAEYQALGMNTDKIQSDYILKTGLTMLGIALLSMVLTIMVSLLASRVAARLARDLRSKTFKKVVGFSNTEFTKFSTASLITRSTNDITQIQMLLVMLLRVVFYAPIMAVGGVLKVLSTNTSMGWIIAVAVMAILTLVIVLFALVMPKFKIVQKLIDKLNLVMREILTGLPVIRAFHREKHEQDRFDKANKDLTKTNLFVNRMMGLMMPLMMLVMNVIMLLIIWNGAHSIDTGAMQVGDMMAFMQYTMEIVMSFLMISMVSIMLPRAAVSAKRIDEVITTEEVIKDPKNPKQFDNTKKGTVEFKDVSFRYPDADYDVITEISFTARPGETTAIIGSTGSGKSTVINLIPRFFDVSGGKIMVDGIDIREVKQHDLRSIIGYVPQKGVLLSGTVASNVTYGNREATEETIEEAITIAQAKTFISELTEGINSPISQGGTNVSGGQKQRLSIARAIAVKPEIYIFDDSFSALDYKTDIALRTALKKITKDSTVLIVAQRISTIMHAEQIIVMDEGKIVGIGTHQELLKNCEVYLQIASSQLSKEELENGK